MISAVVLVNVQSEPTQVIESLRKIEGVEEAHALVGVYDLLLRVKANSIDRLKEIIRLYIRKVAGITGSLTLMILADNP